MMMEQNQMQQGQQGQGQPQQGGGEQGGSTFPKLLSAVYGGLGQVAQTLQAVGKSRPEMGQYAQQALKIQNDFKSLAQGIIGGAQQQQQPAESGRMAGQTTDMQGGNRNAQPAM